MVIQLINALIWPVVVVGAMVLYRKSLSNLIAGFSQRITKFSVFDVTIELANLPAPPRFDSSIPKITEMVGGDVAITDVKPLLDQIAAAKPWDYLIVDIKDGRFWFVSRLFFFTALLQAMWGLKCVVFVESRDASRRRLLGLASPEVVRDVLGEAYPWLESSLKNTLKNSSPHCLGSVLCPARAGDVFNFFVSERNMRLECDPEELLKTPNKCQTPQIRPAEWVRLGKGDKWEHTHWLDLSNQHVSETITKGFYEQDSSQYRDSPDISTERKVRELLARKAPHIALVNSKGEFKALLDRQKLAAMVGEALIKE